MTMTSPRLPGATFLLLISAILAPGCNRASRPTTSGTPKSTSIDVVVNRQGPITVTTSAAEFEIQASGYIRASLLKEGKKLSLDVPQTDAPVSSDRAVVAGKEVNFPLDFSRVAVHDATGKLGPGKVIEIPTQPVGTSEPSIQQILTLEIYDDFPNLLLSSLAYSNAGTTELKLDRIIAQQHRLSAQPADPQVAPYDMWCFQGSSSDWGKDDVFKLAKASYYPNEMGAIVKGGYGGGIPVVAFWTRTVGVAIGHVEALPLTLSLPVKVDSNSQVNAEISIPGGPLKPGETYSTPRTFVAVYSGDFYEPLRLWSRVLAGEGWNLPKPSNEAYNASWCGWGYEINVTPAQMLGTVPKLKELGIRWATLDDRWFDAYGDWNPRSDTFPGNSIQEMVDDFHRQGIKVQLWWLPLGAEDGEGRRASQQYIVSKVAKDHPDWFILDEQGKHARMTRNLGALCPALPEVQAYYRQLTERFIRAWGFDGSKLDNIYTVPMCYSPAHHHKSPQDSVNGMADVYRTIFQTTRAIKPDSVTQSCPCGTPPSVAWLPYMDQAVTADPVGAAQVRRRIKLYKALLGPEAAVYGDHVELSAMTRVGGSWKEYGSDFASTVGVGGVVGTKFVWPDPDAKFKPVRLTPEKEAHWKKWMDIYNRKMLSKGTFLNLYMCGYDVPEGYAIEKDGKMYYAFFAPDTGPWKGEVELRGLRPGTYRVMNYGDGKDLGIVEAKPRGTPTLKTEIQEHLLLEVAP